MQRIFLYILFCFTVLQTRAQQQIVQHKFHFPKYTEYLDAIELSNSDLILSQNIIGITGLNLQSIITKTDSNTNIQWHKELNIPGNNFFINQIINYPNDTFIVQGLTYPNITYVDSSNVVLIKLDSSGTIISQNCINSNFKIYSNGIIRDKSDNIIVYGKIVYTDLMDERMFLAAFDTDLHLLWNKEYSLQQINEITSLANFTDNGFIAQVSTKKFNDTTLLDPQRTVLLMRLDSVGNIIWASRVGNITVIPNPMGNRFVYPGDIAVANNGHIYNIVTTSWFGGFFHDIIFQELDSSGNVLQAIRYGNYITQDKEVNSLKILSNGNLLIRFNKFGLLETDSTFNILWAIYTSIVPNSVIFSTNKELNNGSHLLFGSIQYQYYATLLIITNSALQIGCGNTYTLNFPQQNVTFPNIDKTNSIHQYNSSVSDSNVFAQSINYSALPDSVICQSATYLPDNQNSTAIKVFPLITRSVLNIENNTHYQINKFQILNVLGATATEATLDANSIDVSMLPNGIYILKLFSNNISHTFKFVKQ
ncbi:MAG: hypothetical protein BWX95_00161 [Bacteroidetes bacterium ADurb.Bin141]|nr:MAG: hypothetical protein BWX95_00161 [Bacteroidetes bacterium ADurb.Bin141]